MTRYGKTFRSTEHVDPLVWRGPAWDPGPAPVSYPLLASHPLYYFILSSARALWGVGARPVFCAMAWAFRQPRSQARLRVQQFRGRSSAVMLYDHFPVHDDHIRKSETFKN